MYSAHYYASPVYLVLDCGVLWLRACTAVPAALSSLALSPSLSLSDWQVVQSCIVTSVGPLVNCPPTACVYYYWYLCGLKRLAMRGMAVSHGANAA